MVSGSRRETQGTNLYQRGRYGTFRPMKSSNYGQGDDDIFAFFDFIALSPGDPQVHAVQVKSNGARGIVDWQRYTALFRRFNWETWYLVPYDREGWRLIHVTDDDREDVVDERDQSVNMGEAVVDYLQERNGVA